MCRVSHKKGHVRLESRHRDGKDEKGASCWWSPWIVVSTAVLCYLNSFSCGLVFDDQPAIIENKDLRPTTKLTNLFYNDFWGTPMHKEESHKSYRPLCVLTFRINYWLHELKPFGYHFVNTVLHAFVCFLYHRLCSKFLEVVPSLIASMLFATHPIHTEAVTGVVGRAELLSSIFFLLGLHTYLRTTTKKGLKDYRALLQCLVFSALAMFSKEQGITVVAVCITYDILLVQKDSVSHTVPSRAPRGRIKGPTPTWRKDLVLRLLVMTVGTIFLLTIRMKLMGSRLPVFNKFDNPAAAESWPIRHLTHHYVASLNAWMLIFPWNLCCDWTMGTIPLVKSFLEWRLLITLLFYAVIYAYAWKCYHSDVKVSKIITLGFSLLVFPFVPSSNLLYPVGFVIAERVLYIPSMGFCILVACGWNCLCLAFPKNKYFLRLLIVILVCLNTVKTVQRNFDWQSEETLFKSGLRSTKSNAKLYNNLGHVMEIKGEINEALKLFLKAVDVQPDDLGSHLNVGRIYNRLGMMENAEKAFRMAKALLPKAVSGRKYQAHIAPRHLDLFLDLGNLLSRNDSRLEEAQELYREAISMKTDYIDAYLHRAKVLVKLNRSEEAHDVYKEALKYDQMNPDLFYNMGVLLLEQGKSMQALARFDQALKVDPQHEKSVLNYAILTQDSGDSSLRRIAHERLQMLLDKGRQPERSYFNLGMLAMQDRDTIRAEENFRKALQLRGDFDSALFNLALVLYETGRALEAVPYLQRLDPGHLKGLVLLGNIYFNDLANYTAAQKCFELVLEQDANHSVALHNLCATYFHLGKLKNPEDCLLRAKNHASQEKYAAQRKNFQHSEKINTQLPALLRSETRYCTESNESCDQTLTF